MNLSEYLPIVSGMIGVELEGRFEVGDGKVEVSEVQMGDASVIEDFGVRWIEFCRTEEWFLLCGQESRLIKLYPATQPEESFLR